MGQWLEFFSLEHGYFMIFVLNFEFLGTGYLA